MYIYNIYNNFRTEKLRNPRNNFVPTVGNGKKTEKQKMWNIRGVSDNLTHVH